MTESDFLRSSEPDQIGLEYVLPAQFFQQRRAVSWPVTRMMLAILEDVIGILQRKDVLNFVTQKAKREEYHDAHAWVASDEDWGPFSFVRLCQVLDLEPSWTRRRIRRLQQMPGLRKLSRHQSSRGLGKMQVGVGAQP